MKLGRGGIREIEFFAQTQQLIFGGRRPALRLRGTTRTLRALAAAGHVEPRSAEELIAAYGFLRRVEHRLQMVDDRQTHSLPDDEAGLAAIATFLGYRDAPSFQAEMLATLRLVESHYAHLFEEAPSLAGPGGNLVFTGTDDDPGTLETLGTLGFRDPSAAAGIVRRWHHGPLRATSSARARRLLTELMPALPGAGKRSPGSGAAELRPLPWQPAGGISSSRCSSRTLPCSKARRHHHGQRARPASAAARRTVLLDSVLSPAFYTPLPPASGDDG